MELMALSEHVSSPGMIAGLVVFVILQILSLIALAVIVLEYKLIASKHAILPDTFAGGGSHFPDKRGSRIIWVYILVTIVMTVLSSLLFLFQPHLL